MSALDRAAKARARMDQVRREMGERRAMRIRNGRAAREKAQDSLMKQGPVAAQVAKHMGELGRRHKAAGGWATEKTERDKDYLLGFDGEEERSDEFAYRPAARPQADTPPGGIGALEDEEVEAAAEPAPAPPPPAPEPPVRQVRRPAHAREELDDEDDYSNQSSWMRNQ
jgi:hypothetical protein